MANLVDTAEVRRLIDAGVQLVEVLPQAEYDDSHLPGARNIPLAHLLTRAPVELERERGVVVYCWDLQCDLSARAAAQLDSLGFAQVYEYAESKAAWMGLGLPFEGDRPPEQRAGAIARAIPRCSPDGSVGDYTHTLEHDGSCAVTDDRGVVLGLLDQSALELPPSTPVTEAARLAPPSVRPYLTATELAASMDRDDRSYVLVTLLDGRLVGRIERADLDDVIAAQDRESQAPEPADSGGETPAQPPHRSEAATRT